VGLLDSYCENTNNVHFSPNTHIIGVIKLRRIRWEEYAAGMGKVRIYTFS
jgi:hypothetical protein